MDSDALLLIFPGPTSKYGSALEKCLYTNHRWLKEKLCLAKHYTSLVGANLSTKSWCLFKNDQKTFSLKALKYM